MLAFNPNKKNCTGCSACYSVCPVRCITMGADEEGFLYPKASDTCINCGLCEKVCPAFKPKKDNPYKQKAFAAVSKNDDIWRRSASGGAFSEICRSWADDETLIVGAVWDGLNVHHVGVRGFDSIAPLCKSKYIGSAIEDTFIEIKEALLTGRKAIFCGCPCQVDGLKNYLRKDFVNLLTIDLICHGHGSPAVFRECMNVISEQLGEEVIAYQFRAKRRQYEVDYLSLVSTNKTEHYIVQDPYMQLYLSQNALRPSCGQNCKYRDVRRSGDITIADFKGLSNVFPDMISPKKNWSTVVCNTAKGENCLKKLKESMEVRPVQVADVIKFNPLFAMQTWFSKERDAFFSDFTKNSNEAVKKWTKPLTIYRTSLRKRLLSILPYSLNVVIHKIIQEFKRFFNLIKMIS